MIEIRIYYESLEQAEHFTKPIIQKILKPCQETKITLVRKATFRDDEDALKNGNVMRGIYSIVVPDVLITLIKDGIETPLAIIEFTEAVTTEDHELQRSYGAVAALLAGCFYIKVSGLKQSKKEFGGAAFDPYISPRAFWEKLGYRGFIIADWETEKDNPYVLKRLTNFLACPPELPLLEEVISQAIQAFLENKNRWFEITFERLEKTQLYKEFWKKVLAAETTEERTAIWEGREERKTGEKNSLRYFVRKDWIGAKINRFSHVMDPDRGILIFISTLFSSEKKVYGIYALVRPRSGKELKKPLEHIEDLPRRFELALEKDEQKLEKWLADEICKKIAKVKKLDDVIDVHDVFEADENKIFSRVIQTLAYFLDGIYLNHNGVKIVWDKYKLLGCSQEDFLEGLRQKLRFNVKSEPLEIEEIKDDITEDEVTYTIVHRVLIPNKFRVVSVSYPGAQGGMAILPEPEKGKSQKRTYLDIIALPPKDSDIFDVLLNENKGEFSTTKVEKDVKKLRDYVTNPSHQNALKESLIEAKVINEQGELKKIIIGVGFGNLKKKTTNWNPGEVDFIFCLQSREKWKIACFVDDLSDLIKPKQGETNFPVVFKVKKAKKKSKKKIEDDSPKLFNL